jgi:N-acyl-D-amino-acid deacylase
MSRWIRCTVIAGATWIVACASPDYDLILRNGTVYDGSGEPGLVADVAIDGDTIAAIGDLADARGATEIGVPGLAVSPGFVNMLSWASTSLIADGRGLSDIVQGVTLEVMGEGNSMGPLNDDMRQRMQERQTDIQFDVTWTTLDEYLQWLADRGVSPNIASFMGATTARIHVLGYEDRAPTPDELEQMRGLVRQAMQDGAMGVSSALIYTPAFYADTDELIALAQVAGEYGGMYISHMRNEANYILEALDELITVAREAGVPAEIYHLKASGRRNWPKLELVIERVEAARRQGLRITADMYTYHASSTGLNATMPAWVQEGGHDAWVERLKDPQIRARVKREMNDPDSGWESTWLNAGSPENILLISFRTDSLRYLTGKTLAEVAEMRGTPPEETAMDLVIQDDSRVGAVFFTMSEDNIRTKIAVPWVSFGSDGAALAPEGVFLNSQPHPRGYGNFARLLGKYVREERVIPLEEAIRRLTSQPASNLGLRDRGKLAPGYYADVVVFDPATITDNATFEQPHQLATGVVHVFVNGQQVLADGEHTGALPGRVVRGPGWRGDSETQSTGETTSSNGP